MFGLFPPSSRVTRFKFVFAALSKISCPTFNTQTISQRLRLSNDGIESEHLLSKYLNNYFYNLGLVE